MNYQQKEISLIFMNIRLALNHFRRIPSIFIDFVNASKIEFSHVSWPACVSRYYHFQKGVIFYQLTDVSLIIPFKKYFF